MPLEIVRNDITKMNVDAIVNAAKPQLKMGGGVCGAIFKAAGSQTLQQACDQIGHCPVGQAVITEGFNLRQAILSIHQVRFGSQIINNKKGEFGKRLKGQFLIELAPILIFIIRKVRIHQDPSD